MARLILHIGGHRTGSTSIQQSLFDARERLKSCGILYPETGLYTVCHHLLGYSIPNFAIDGFFEIPQFEPLLRQLTVEIGNSGCETVLISSETFCEIIKKRDDPETTEKLQRFLGLFSDVSTIFFVRYQVPYLESRYKFQVRWCHRALTMDFPEFIQPKLLNFEQNYALNYIAIEPFFRSVRQDIGFQYVNFAEAMKTGFLVKFFYDRAGISAAYESEVQLNESFSRAAALAMLMWNRGLVASSRSRKEFEDWSLQAFPEQAESLYDDALLDQVVDTFAASNAELAARSGFNLNDELDAFTRKYSLCGWQVSPQFANRVRAFDFKEPPCWKSRLRKYVPFLSG